MVTSFLVVSCQNPANRVRRFCGEHWTQLAGSTRSRLSMTARTKRSAVTEEIWDRARREIESLTPQREG